MDPRDFWEKCLDIIDESDVKVKIGRVFVKFYVSFSLLLVLLEIRPCCLIEGEEHKKARDLIIKSFPGIFKIKNVKSSHPRPGSSGSDFVWSTKEPKSPTKKDLKTQRNFVEYIGRVLDYSCPGDILGITPWSKSWAIKFSLSMEGDKEEYGFFGEVCVNKSHFRARLRDFQKAATLISSSEKKYKVTKTIRLQFLPPNRWVKDHDWNNISNNEKFYKIGEEIEKEILDVLWDLYYYSWKSKWKETKEVELQINLQDVKKIKETFPNMYVFEKVEDGYNVSSKLM